MSQKIFDDDLVVLHKSYIKAYKTSICWDMYIRLE